MIRPHRIAKALTKVRNIEAPFSFMTKSRKQSAEKYIKKLNDSGEYNAPVVTLLEPASKFYHAEEYHQDYFRRNPNAGYCQSGRQEQGPQVQS